MLLLLLLLLLCLLPAALAVYLLSHGLLQTAFSFLGRMRKAGGMSDLKDVMGRWKPWIPPKQDQAFQQVRVVPYGGDTLW